MAIIYIFYFLKNISLVRNFSSEIGIFYFKKLAFITAVLKFSNIPSFFRNLIIYLKIRFNNLGGNKLNRILSWRWFFILIINGRCRNFFDFKTLFNTFRINIFINIINIFFKSSSDKSSGLINK